MNIYPYYEVEITKGRFTTDGMKSDSIQFRSPDLLEARKKALQYKILMEIENKGKFDDPSFVRDTPELIPMLEAFSVDINFVTEENSLFNIYGDTVFESAIQLHYEAKYYVGQNLITSDELVKILIKSDDSDEINPTYLFASTTTEVPDFEFEELYILPYDIKVILGDAE